MLFDSNSCLVLLRQFLSMHRLEALFTTAHGAWCAFFFACFGRCNLVLQDHVSCLAPFQHLDPLGLWQFEPCHGVELLFV